MHKPIISVLCLILLCFGMMQTHFVDKLDASSEKKRGYAELPQSKLFRKESYTPIQPLVDAIPAGGELQLPGGEFAGPLIVNKPIAITGQGNDTILHISDEEQVVSLQSDNITFSQLSIQDTREAPQAPTISSEGYQKVALTDLHILTSATAVELRNMDQITLERNRVSWGGRSYAKRTSRGNGFYLYNTRDVNLTDNQISSVYDGIYVENGLQIRLKGNQISDSRYAYHLMYSEQIELLNNESTSSVTGMMVMASNHVILHGNVLYQHQGNANAAAILIYDVENASVNNNYMAENRIGLNVERSKIIKIENNELLHNFVALQIQRAEELQLQRNDFIGNVTNVWDDGSSKPLIEHNYWDTLQGLDLDGDGYSELSYKSSPFFLSLIERRPSFQLLFGTTGIAFIEQLYVAEAKQWIGDDRPSIKRQVADSLDHILASSSVELASKKQGVDWGMLIIWTALSIAALYTMLKVRRIEQ